MKTNALLAICALLLGALVMLMSSMAFGLTTPAQAQDSGDDDKNTPAANTDFKALALQASSDREVLVVLKKVPSEHPFHKSDYPMALSMAAYSIEMSGAKSGMIHLLGSRYVDYDLLLPEVTKKFNKGPSLNDMQKHINEYRKVAAKAQKKK